MRPYLQRGIDETGGTVTIKELREELATRGHWVPYTSLRDWACSRLEWPDSPEPTSATPSVRAVAAQLKAILDIRPELDQAHGLVRDFTQMLARRARH
ncbi:hypothetical protein [Streptomyces sp. NPDC004270]